jgi:PAS domain S-box-containing protein
MLKLSESLYLSVTIQLLLTIFLVTVLWTLYSRLQRLDFFRWWAWAWTASASYLAAATVSMALGPTWTYRKATLILILLLSGFFQPLLLLFGGLSWGSPAKPSRRQAWLGASLAASAALLSFALAFAFRQVPVVSFAVRNLPRSSGLAAALLFCCVASSRQFRAGRSYAAAITGVFCLSYALNQTLYFLSFTEMLTSRWDFHFPLLLHRLVNFQIFTTSKLLYMDLVDTCGICLGMIMLFVERHQRTVSELEASERRRLGLAVDNVSLQLEIRNRQRAELELRRSEEFIRQVIANSPLAMVVSRGPQESVELVNEKFTSLFGYTPAEMRSVSDWWPLAYPDPEYRRSAQTQWEKLIQEANQGGAGPLSMEARVRCKDGTSRDIEFHLSLVNDLYVVSFVDLTEQKKALEGLRDSVDRFRLMANTVASAIWLFQNEQFVYFNKEFENLTGYSREEIQAMNSWDLIHPDFRELCRDRGLARLRGEPVPARYEFAFLTKTGEKRWVDFSAALTEFNGKPAILSSAFDITAAKRTGQELREHAMYMDALISNIPLGVVIKDDNQLVRFCNAAFERMFLFQESEIQGKNLDELIAPHDRQEADLLSHAIREGGVVHAMARRRRKDGSFIDVELYGVRVFSGDTFVGAFAIYQDITDRKRSEEKLTALRNRLSRAQEEERARIARDLHDDTGQRLALLSIDLEQLTQLSMELKSSLTHQLESLVKAASEITTDVHNVSRRLHPSQVELLGLPAALSSFCKDFGARNSMEIELVAGGLQNKPAQDAALCLFRVAQEAIRNVQKHSGATRALIQLDEVSGSLRLRISDQGAGFDPKSADLTHGLGLLSMQERLHSLGGELFIHSRPGGGTCIEACIPLSPAVPA